MVWVFGVPQDVEEMSRAPTIVSLSIIFTVLMIVVGSMRFWVRRQKLSWEDWIILATMLFSIVYNTCAIVETRYGLGLPLHLRPKSEAKNYTLYNYTSRPFYLWGIAGFKLALCMSYLRLTERSAHPRYRLFIIVVAVFSTLAQTVFVLLNLFSCVPLAKNLNQSLPGHCLPYAPINYTISAVTILCDVIIFLLPVPLVQSLRMDRATRLGLSFVFCLGLLTTVCSIVRMTYIGEIAHGDGNSSMLVLVSALEINVGIITSCLPVLRPLLMHLPSKIRGTLSPSLKKNQPGQGTPGNSYPLQSSSRNREKISTRDSFPRLGTRKTVASGLGDGDSETEILSETPHEAKQREASMWNDGSITRTVEVYVESSQNQHEKDIGWREWER